MDFHEGLQKRIRANSGVAAIAGARVTWMERPQKGALPAVTLQVISDPRPAHLKGNDGSLATRVQADCWAATYDAALMLARAVPEMAIASSCSKNFSVYRDRVEGKDDAPSE